MVSKRHFLLSLFIMILPFLSYGYSQSLEKQNIERSEEMKAYLPSEDENLKLESDPVKFLEAIQLDYHFRSYERGLKRTQEALKAVAPLYEKDAPAIPYEQLPMTTAQQLYGALLTFEGMFNQSLAIESIGVDPDADEKAQADKRKLAVELMQKAEESLKKAVEINPDSAEAYFQLGKFYTNQMAGLSTEQAEEALFKAAELSKQQDNDVGFDQAKAALLALNMESSYLTKLIEMEK